MLIIVLVIVVIILIAKNKRQKIGEFCVRGKKGNYKITKNKNIEFIVENDEIVAFIDKRVSNKKNYYKE